MPTRKASKSTAKAKKVSSAAVRGGAVPPYGIGIREAVGRGDVAEMKKVAASARKWLKDIQAALSQLEKAIGKKG